MLQSWCVCHGTNKSIHTCLNLFICLKEKMEHFRLHDELQMSVQTMGTQERREPVCSAKMIRYLPVVATISRILTSYWRHEGKKGKKRIKDERRGNCNRERETNFCFIDIPLKLLYIKFRSILSILTPNHYTMCFEHFLSSIFIYIDMILCMRDMLQKIPPLHLNIRTVGIRRNNVARKYCVGTLPDINTIYRASVLKHKSCTYKILRHIHILSQRKLSPYHLPLSLPFSLFLLFSCCYFFVTKISQLRIWYCPALKYTVSWSWNINMLQTYVQSASFLCFPVKILHQITQGYELIMNNY